MKTPRKNKLPQKGVIFLALVLVLFVTGSTLMLGALNNRQDAYLTQQAELHEQLEIAKANLLAYLANSNALFGDTQGPGFFPCPDTNNDGVAEAICNPTNTTLPACNSNTSRPGPLVGRLPEYVEQSGHRIALSDYNKDLDRQFWYVLGPRYIYHTTTSTSRRSRLRTSTSITVSTPGPACMRMYLDGTGGYVAFIIAPGETLGTQNRADNPTLYANYLDGQNGANNYYYYTSYAANPETFNDRIIGITLEEYVKAVGIRVAIESKQEMDVYYPSRDPDAYPSNATNFRAALDEITDHPWLMPTATTGNNGERWSTDTAYTGNSNTTATINFSGCTGITFSLTYPDGVAPADVRANGTAC